jgi:hypothetical protein
VHLCEKVVVCALELGLSICVPPEWLFEDAFVFFGLAYIIYELGVLVQAFPNFSGCALVCTCVKKWWCVQIALELGFSI